MRKNPPPPYIEEKAVELRRIKNTSFRNEFFDTMQECNYSRFIEEEKFRFANFVGDRNDENDPKVPK